MGKITIILNEVIELNHRLEEKGLSFKLHLRDACGNQSFWLEPLSNSSREGEYEDMREVVADYFIKKGITIRFLEDQLQFIIE